MDGLPKRRSSPRLLWNRGPSDWEIAIRADVIKGRLNRNDSIELPTKHTKHTKFRVQIGCSISGTVLTKQ